MSRLVEGIIDGQPIGRLQRLVVALLFLTMFLDGLDLQLLAYAAPVITGEWNVTKLQLAPAMSATLIGTATGAFIGGALGDGIGRRWALIVSAFLFGAGTLLCAHATNIAELAIFRFTSGLGFGACFPSAVAITAEWLPKRSLSKATGMIQVGVPAGAMIGALISGVVIPALGWRASFISGGLLPLALAVVMIFVLPESPAWLARKTKNAPRALEALRRAYPSLVLPQASEIGMDSTTANLSTGGYRQVVGGIPLRTNVGVWLGFFANGLAAYGFMNWGTSALTSAGLPLSAALRGAFLYSLAGLIATFPAAYLAARFGTRPVMMVLSLLGASTLAGLFVLMSVTPAGQAESVSMLLFCGFFLSGACLNGLQGLLYIIGAHAYPTECRASGIGLGATIARVGGILSGLAGGALLSLFPAGVFFLAAAVTVLGVTSAALIFDRHRPAERLVGQ